MTTSKLIAIALAALLVSAGGAAALPGQAPGDPSANADDEHQPDDPGADASNETDTDANESTADGNVTDTEDVRDENATDAPPIEMPEQAPDHVSQIHEHVRDKLNGALSGQELGEAISGLMGDDDARASSQTDSVGEQSENASDTSEDARTDAGPTDDLPGQAADHVNQIHDAIQSWLSGSGNGTPGDEVSSTAG